MQISPKLAQMSLYRTTLRPFICRRLASKLINVHTCQDYLDFCRENGTALDGPVCRGTLYELTVKNILEKSFHCFNLVRSGGAGDNGLDIFGRWNLGMFHDPQNASTKIPRLSLLSLCKPYFDRKTAIDIENDIVMLVQCKNYKLKIAAATVRELAGIREFHINMRLKADKMKTFMMLVSPLPMTKQGQRQMDTSDVPMLHMQVSPLLPPKVPGPDDFCIENWSGGIVGPVYMNHMSRLVLQGFSVERELSQVVR
ncbi:Protein of unknown function DUF2034 [Metschnikowia aff. pulcherrima]|uniref:Required for respiratory growth protein 7, mitochondrial n=1 Tax=Metschnikowia aff. pulcherrima TaxID=2163413 RepID=A0A4P6XS37_9ASCO|nr:Protein of unknown function DUF2034 [Metschnikowia aff. pulcherrima]